MEAVPKLTFLSFELKTSPESTHFGPKLKQYIAEAYREDPDSYNNEIHQLECLRSAAVRPTIDSVGLSSLLKYLCQLKAVQSRFPMAKGQPVSVTFSWKDLYANMSCTVSDIRFEMASILYNIGALYTQLAAAEPRTSADSLKSACTKFQNAAWAFEYLREQYPQPSGVDVSSDIIRMLQEICFAQAQECILEKSIQDTKKPSVVGAVAAQVRHFYKNSIALLGPSSGNDIIYDVISPKNYNYWYRYLTFKALYAGCLACLYQGMNAEEQQKMGERVAFYQQSVNKLAEARKLARYIPPSQGTLEAMTFTNDVVEGKKKAAKNENEFIYHEEVPDKDMLVDIKPVCLVKAIPINLLDPEISGPDIFARLVPMGAHEASSMYSEEKAKLLRQIVGQTDIKNTEILEFMSSLQLEQLDVLDSDQKIPQEIVDRCAAMNAKTDIIQTLVDTMNNLAEIISDVEHSLAEIKILIQEETAKEVEYQKMMGHRPPSIVQTELSREFHKYQEAHSRTNESNQVLHKAMTLHIANLRLLAQPLDVLQSKIPSIENIEGLDRATMNEMRRVVGKAREMQAQRDSLVQQLREAITNDDITSKLLARSSEPAEEIFKQELEKHTPQVKIIEQNLAAQENIINKLTSLYASYGDSRRLLSEVLRKREGLINALITSYDTYEELLGKSQKGLEFYKKLSHNVSQLLTRVRSTCQVQEEERAQLLAKQSSKAAAPPTSTMAKTVDAALAPPAGGGRKLKDYLPYMKNRISSRNIPPQAQAELLPADTYYPESIYPTSVRPAPVGSEATDLSQMKVPDGVVMPSGMQDPNAYNRFSAPYASTETEQYAIPANYNYPMPGKSGYEKPEDMNYGYSTPYTPPQYSTQVADPQIYSHPYYSGNQVSNTVMTDSVGTNPYSSNMQSNVNPITSQYNAYDPYASSQIVPTPDTATTMAAYNAQNQEDLNINFAQMNINTPQPEAAPQAAGAFADYSQTYYSVQYPQAATPNMATYSHAEQNAATNMTSSNLPAEYSCINYPYSSNPQMQSAQLPQPSQQMPAAQHIAPPQPEQSVPQANINASTAYTAEYSYATSSYGNVAQTYPVYTNANNTAMLPSNVPVNANLPYTYPTQDAQFNHPPFSQLDALDKPIKSHVTGEALAADLGYKTNYQHYDQTVPNYSNAGQINQANYSYPNQSTSADYSQTYQNHPGYTYNPATGNYDYNYGSQNTYTNYGSEQIKSDCQTVPKDGNWNAPGVYTNAGICDTVQSPSETPQSAMPPVSNEQTSQMYYNTPYGYQTAMQNQNQPMPAMPQNQNMPVSEPTSQPASTNYGAYVNQSTYMQSDHAHGTRVTFANNQVSSPKEEVAQPSFPEQQNVENKESGSVNVRQEKPSESKPMEPVKKEEPSVFDLLSDIDFSVEHKPLMPEIKVPQISENAIKKPLVVQPMPVQKPVVKEEILERPAKIDIFSDPVLLNKFTQEMKNLRHLVDSLDGVGSGNNLDEKWNMFQVEQEENNHNKSKTIAIQHGEGSNATDIVPYDDSRLTLKSDSNAFINASYYKQLASWCIPLTVSKNPTESEYGIFWKAVLENKISCVVCLLSEIEMQGTCYWPTAKGQSLDLAGGVKVSLEEVKCTVHWTERKLSVSCGNMASHVSHYQINVYPARIVCPPLVLLADKILQQTYEGRLSNQLTGALLQCSTGGGRCCVLASLLMVMCQLRAGQCDLCDMLDSGCKNLYRLRTNVLEQKKYLLDAYKTALFYVQGVFCSGTTMFNGEAVSVPSGASVLPPVTPSPSPPAAAPSTKLGKSSRESFEEMKQSPGLKSGDMKDPLNFLDPLWSLKKK
ncbi:hypothetical protein ACJJTC_011881 [Scirpophaga incertulas]